MTKQRAEMSPAQLAAATEANRSFRTKNREKYLESQRAYYEKYRDEILLKDKRKRMENPAGQLLKRVRERARRRGLEFNLEVGDLAVPMMCPVLGIPLVLGGGKPQAGTPTVDRIDNSKGYVKGNVAVISHRANRIKNDASAVELQAVLSYVTRS
jgi:hypothetical protein